MPAVSQQQQKLMALALAYKRGEVKDVSAKVKEIADSMSEKDLEDFASTKHKGLPMKKEELIKEGLSVLKEQTYNLDTFGVKPTVDPKPIMNPFDDGTNKPKGLSPSQVADRDRRAYLKTLQKGAINAKTNYRTILGTQVDVGYIPSREDIPGVSGKEWKYIEKYYTNARKAAGRGYFDDSEFGSIKRAMDTEQRRRLSRSNIPAPEEDRILGSFADRFMASGGRSRDAGSGGSKRVARGAIVTPKSSGRGTPATARPTPTAPAPTAPAPTAPAPTATTTSATTAASQNFLKNIDPKLAAGIAAGTLGAAGLAAFVANRRRKKKKG